MAPLPFASLSDIYNNNNNNNNNADIIHRNLAANNQFVQNNAKHQEYLQQNQTSGKPNFTEEQQKIPGPNLGQGQNIPPNIPNSSINRSENAPRPSTTNILNDSLIQKGINMFNRFQTPIDYLSDQDQLVAILQEISFILKIIMILMILMFICKLMESKK